MREDGLALDDPLIRPSERHGFSEMEAEIEHYKKETAIFRQKALVTDDMKNQNETL